MKPVNVTALLSLSLTIAVLPRLDRVRLLSAIHRALFENVRRQLPLMQHNIGILRCFPHSLIELAIQSTLKTFIKNISYYFLINKLAT